jgi:hypothetical protein
MLSESFFPNNTNTSEIYYRLFWYVVYKLYYASIDVGTLQFGFQNIPLTHLQLSGAGIALTTAAGPAMTVTEALPVSLPPGITFATSTATIDTITLPAANSTKDLGTGPSSIVPAPAPSTTREYFLCGTCNLGFSSMDECRMHMMTDHNAAAQTGHVSDTVFDRYIVLRSALW